MFGSPTPVRVNDDANKARRLTRAELIHQRRIKAARLATQRAFDYADSIFEITAERRGK